MITRRLFLLGAASATALAKWEMPVQAETMVTELAIPQRTAFLRRREVVEVTTSFESAFPGIAQVTIGVTGRESKLHWAVNQQGGLLRWVACPGQELVMLPDEALVVDVSSSDAQRCMAMLDVINAEYDEPDAVPIFTVERYDFHDRALILRWEEHLHPDNSLEARRERFRLRAQAKPQSEWDEKDWDKYFEELDNDES